MATLTARGLEKRFGDARVIADLDLDVAHGEFVVLVGPSGCGKSTLLRMIAGLEEISAGRLELGGDRADRLPPQKRDVAMVFQSYALWPNMTVRENLLYGPKVRGESGADIEGVAALLNLSAHLDKHPGALSGGQRQRVAMGRALLRHPKLFLFDEPLSNLDAQLRVAMRAEIKALHARLGATMIYVTHDQVEAMTMADRIVVMREGRIVQQGPPLALYDQPADLFVAGFLGSPAINLFRGRRSGGTVRFGGEELVIGVRPHDLTLIEPPHGLPAVVRVVEPMGHETHILADLEDPSLAAGGAAETATDLRLVAPGRSALRPGDPCRVALPTRGLHLFDPATGARIPGAAAAAA
jgi:multiple sugar transport system ATP-binding protein